MEVLTSLKLQSYMNNQNLDDDTLNFLGTLKFNELYTTEQFLDIKNKVETFRSLDSVNRQNPTAEASKRLQELNQDILYATGKDANTIQLSQLNTVDKLEQAIANSNIRSKNDLFVDIDYDNYNYSSNFVKCKLVGHDHPYAYGIAANAKFVVTKAGDIITTRNALYTK